MGEGGEEKGWRGEMMEGRRGTEARSGGNEENGGKKKGKEGGWREKKEETGANADARRRRWNQTPCKLRRVGTDQTQHKCWETPGGNEAPISRRAAQTQPDREVSAAESNAF